MKYAATTGAPAATGRVRSTTEGVLAGVSHCQLSPAVIPGRAEGASPESERKVAALDSGFARFGGAPE